MNIKKRLISAFLLILAIMTTLLVTSSPAQASSAYDGFLQVAPALTVYTDGDAKTNTLDVSHTWWSDFKQSYSRRQAAGVGWPTNFVSEFEHIVSSGGSWGVLLSDTSFGKVISIIGTDDPNATCNFGGTISTGYYGCWANAGYEVLKADNFTNASYGGNGCSGAGGANVCSDDQMNIYSAPTITPASSYGTWAGVISNSNPVTTKEFIWNYHNNYPSGYAGDILPTMKPTSNVHDYVALGDSFSSGEGNSPFNGFSDVTDIDQCHRSNQAYPEVLANSTTTSKFADLSFVACSGAVMSDITNIGHQWGEAPQIDALSPSTSIVSVSIGGNDVEFANALEKCILTNTVPTDWTQGQEAYDRYSCTQALEHSESIINGYTLLGGNQTFTAKYESTLSSILNAVGTGTQVYVLDYPNLFPNYNSAFGQCIWGVNLLGWGQTSGRSVTEDDVNLVRQVTSELDTTMSTAVTELNDTRLHFVDVRGAFTDHEACTTGTPYMYQINAAIRSGTFHPNSAGQAAYADVLATAVG